MHQDTYQRISTESYDQVVAVLENPILYTVVEHVTKYWNDWVVMIILIVIIFMMVRIILKESNHDNRVRNWLPPIPYAMGFGFLIVTGVGLVGSYKNNIVFLKKLDDDFGVRDVASFHEFIKKDSIWVHAQNRIEWLDHRTDQLDSLLQVIDDKARIDSLADIQLMLLDSMNIYERMAKKNEVLGNSPESIMEHLEGSKAKNDDSQPVIPEGPGR